MGMTQVVHVLVSVFLLLSLALASSNKMLDFPEPPSDPLWDPQPPSCLDILDDGYYNAWKLAYKTYNWLRCNECCRRAKWKKRY